MLTFAYRYMWYASITIVLLYVVNTIATVTTTRVVRMVACLFITVTLGGLLGVVAPYFEFPSLVEVILPSQLTNLPLVNSIVHPSAAQLQGVLGFEAPRPSAPFAYTNTWGLNFAVTLPFFLLGWLGKDAGWRRWFAGPILLAAAVPAVYSINRGMWGALVAMALFVAVRAAMTKRPGLLVAIAAGMTAVVVVVVVSPLGTIVSLRLANEGSEQGRTNLGSLAVESVVKTSPLVGLGSTRDVQGNFTSISGGETAQCPACSPPALGTQGQLWLVVFSQGLVGLVLFGTFFGLMFFRHLRLRSPVATMGLAVMVAGVLTFAVYDSLGMGMLVLMIAIGLLCREPAEVSSSARASFGTSRDTALRPLDEYLVALQAGLPLVVALSLVGLVLGGLFSLIRPSPVDASVSVLLPEPAIRDFGTYPGTSLDTEAQQVASAEVRQAAAIASGQSAAAVSDDLSVTATPNTRVLQVRFSAPSEEQARDGAEAATQTLLQRRAAALEQERDSALLPLRARESSLVTGTTTLIRQIRSDRTGGAAGGQPTPLQRQLRNVLYTQTLQVQEELERLSALPLEEGLVLGATSVTQPTDGIKVNVVSGLAAGAGLGAVLVVLFGPRLRGAGDVRRATGLPLVATVPATAGGAAAVASMLQDRGVDYFRVDDDRDVVALTDQLAGRERLRSDKPPVTRGVVAVASPRTGAKQVRRAAERWRRHGLAVRGLVLATEPSPISHSHEPVVRTEPGGH